MQIAYVFEVFGLQIIFIDGKCQDLYHHMKSIGWLIKKFLKNICM